jgi:phage regulator Rha-like protein
MDKLELQVIDGVQYATSYNLANVINAEHRFINKSIRYLFSCSDKFHKHYIKYESETNEKHKGYYITKTGINILLNHINNIHSLINITK